MVPGAYDGLPSRLVNLAYFDAGYAIGGYRQIFWLFQ